MVKHYKNKWSYIVVNWHSKTTPNTTSEQRSTEDESSGYSSL